MANIKFLFIAPSGAGKDTIVNELCVQKGLKRIKSYTTRPSRGTPEDRLSHDFISVREFKQIPKEEVVAKSVNAGNYYCCTKAQLNSGCLYIVDPTGARDLLNKVKKLNIEVKIIALKTNINERKLRMRFRGDLESVIKHRLKCDKKEFKNYLEMADLVIDNCQPVDVVVDTIFEYILKCSMCNKQKLGELNECN